MASTSDHAVSRRSFLRTLLANKAVAALATIVGLLLLAAGVWLLWQARSVLLVLAGIAVLIVAIRWLGERMPWPDAWRAAARRRQALDARFPSHRWQPLLWIGMTDMVVRGLKAWSSGIPDPVSLYSGAIIALPGLIALIVWRLRDRHRV